MQLTPEIKAQLAEQKKQCVYCKIVAGEIPGKIVYQDAWTSAALDIYPALKGHTFFMLKEHYPIMPYIPAEEFKHFFGLIPGLCKAVKDGIVTTSVNVFIANGGVAGQRPYPFHFSAHVFPRDPGDSFFNFLFKGNEQLDEGKKKMLAHNLPIMMQNHFGRNPAAWHLGKGDVPNYLKEIHESGVLYEDEQVLVVLAEKSVIPGHIEIYSKVEEKNVENLSPEESAHLFYAASFAATAAFEGLGAQGTNIILKSGKTDDNPEGRLVIHVLPRYEGDSLQGMLWEPKQPSYDLDSVAGKIKDKTWKMKIKEEKSETVIVKPDVIKISSAKEEDDPKGTDNPEDEIKKAIDRMRG